MKNKVLSIGSKVKNFFYIKHKIETSIASLIAGLFLAATSTMVDKNTTGQIVRSIVGVMFFYLWIFLFYNFNTNKVAKTIGTIGINFVVFFAALCGFVFLVNNQDGVFVNILFSVSVTALIYQLVAFAVLIFKTGRKLMSGLFSKLSGRETGFVKFIEKLFSILLTGATVAFTIANLWFLINGKK